MGSSNGMSQPVCAMPDEAITVLSKTRMHLANTFTLRLHISNKTTTQNAKGEDM
jgi:hypothetical protein